MMVNSIEFNPLVVIAGAAVLCAAVSFIVARRNIRARPVFVASPRRNGEEKPSLVDVYVAPLKGEYWKEIMVWFCSTTSWRFLRFLMCFHSPFPLIHLMSMYLDTLNNVSRLMLYSMALTYQHCRCFQHHFPNGNRCGDYDAVTCQTSRTLYSRSRSFTKDFSFKLQFCQEEDARRMGRK